MSAAGPDVLAVAPAAAAAPHAAQRGIAESSRILELDALRGFAAMGILALHTMGNYFFWAWSCVDLFFILSGFLITSILLANADSPRMLMSFYVRRTLRIWPVYYLTLLVSIAIYLAAGRLAGGAWPGIPNGQWLCFIFLQYTEYYLTSAPGFHYIQYFEPSWSLAVEEQFYLLWPLAFFLFRPGFKAAAATCLVLTAIALYARGHGAFFFFLLTRVDGLLCGVFIAFLAFGRDAPLYRIPPRWILYAAAAGLALVLPYVIVGLAHHMGPRYVERTIEVSGFCLLFAAMIVAAVRWRGSWWMSPLRWRFLVHVGRISFAVYMYQLPIIYLTRNAVEHHWLPGRMASIVIWVATLASAHLSYVYLERRALALKARFPYRQPTEAARV